MSDINKPLVGIVCCRKEIERHPFHVVGEKYIKAIHEFSNVTSVLIPSDDLASMMPILRRLDGFLLTGSLSNVHPDSKSLDGCSHPLWSIWDYATKASTHARFWS